MTNQVKTYAYIDKFQCLGADCADTCCKGWGMQVDEQHVDLYRKEAPELLDAVTSGEAEYIMKRDPETDFCIKFEDGLCSIHKEKGTEFLGDACHFYPRITRKFGDQNIMSATLSCPEITRMTLFEEGAFELSDNEIDRIPNTAKDYLPKEVDSEAALSVIKALLEMTADKNVTPERTMAKLVSIAHSLQSYQPEQWAEGINLLIKLADGRLPQQENSTMDSYNLMHTLAGLIFASKKTARPRLEETFSTMESTMDIEIDRETLDIKQKSDNLNAPQNLQQKWQKSSAEKMAPVLRGWIQAQLAMSGFPFAGFGKDTYDRAVIIAVRFATIKLALMSHMDENGNPPDEETTIRVIQSISRFMDHLADPELSMSLYNDAGWTREPRLRALIGDT